MLAILGGYGGYADPCRRRSRPNLRSGAGFHFHRQALPSLAGRALPRHALPHPARTRLAALSRAKTRVMDSNHIVGHSRVCHAFLALPYPARHALSRQTSPRRTLPAKLAQPRPALPAEPRYATSQRTSA